MKKKIILGVIILLILVCGIYITRNFIILTKIQNNATEYKDINNCHVKIVTSQNDGTIITANYYTKDNNKVVFLERKNGESVSKMSIYDNETTHHTFNEGDGRKTVNLNAGYINVQVEYGTTTESFVEKVFLSVITKIKIVNENGKKYYSLRNFKSHNNLYTENQEMLIDSETGLIYKVIDNQATISREYEFNNVDDKVFVEPNISEYEIIK